MLRNMRDYNYRDGYEDGYYDGRHSRTKTGCALNIGLGSIIAVIISWSLNQSVLWAIIHGFFGWWYVLYYIFFLR